MIIARSVAAVVLPNKREPHSGRKPRLRVLPLSALLSWYLTLPVILSAAAGMPIAAS